MPGVKLSREDTGRLVVTVSQSWIGTFFDCAESARRELLDPEMDGTNEQHQIGTTLHTYAAQRLRGWDADRAKVWAQSELLVEFPRIKHVRIKTFETAWRYAEEAIAAWEAEMFPSLDPSYIETTLQAALWGDDDILIMLEGTPDLIDADGDIHDWKTTTKPWDYREKQKWAIQPTAYYALAQGNQLSPSGTFRYWVWNKQEKQSQRITVTRTDADVIRLGRQARQIAHQIVNYIDAPRWAMNDQSWLCSEKWCPWHPTCPVSGFTDRQPKAPVTLDALVKSPSSTRETTDEEGTS
jgi:hypothetical protein